jgi:hypothetical protein
MVRGIEKFKEYFAEYDKNYIIIGGTVCDILEENAGQFRHRYLIAIFSNQQASL